MANPNFSATMSSNEIWRDMDDTRCITDDLDTIESNITALQTGKAEADHTHSGYAPTSHTHTEYAGSEHQHSYNNLTDKPTIPSEYTHPENHPADMITGLATVATSGNYDDLNGKPIIPVVPFTEDATYPGCFYRTVNDEIEWINPPMVVGEEYQTTKRCDGKTVYVKRMNFGALPNNTVKSVYAFNGEWYRVVELKGMMVDSRNTWLVEPLPNSQVRLFAHNEYVKIQTDADMSPHTAYIDIKYTKD